MKHSLRSAVIGISTLVLLASNSYAYGHGTDHSHDAPSALDAALAAQSDDHKARYGARHPKETLEFFEVKAGDTVVEALPGGGWYTKILLPFLGEEGTLIGVDYEQSMWQHFGGFATEEFIEKKKAWTTTWPAGTADWGIEHSAPVSAVKFGAIPEALNGTADKVLLIRALHNVARFESKGGYLTTALNNSFSMLKPGGILGVVQHEAREDRSDEWAGGNAGYLKQSFIVEAATKAGFELVESSDINNNELDQAQSGDIVWRLPKGLATSKEDPELAAQMNAIGESNRMTLKFRKPE